MKFWKMNGAGNDFIIINNNEEHIPHDKLPCIIKLLCKDRMSLGADGFMVVESATEGSGADFRMLFFNNDGSMGEMCGNGARCISRYGIENGLCKDGFAKVETTAGIVTGKRIDRLKYRVRLNDPMVLEPDKEMIIDEKYDFWKKYVVERALRVDSEGRLIIEASYVELGRPGSPHLVVEYADNVSKIGNSESLRDADIKELYKLGEALRFNSALPKGANVNFYEVSAENEVFVRTYERGVEDFTLACGTGAGSTASILTLKEKVSGSNVRIEMLGGDLYLDVEEVDEEEDGNVSIHGLYLTGPTNVVAKGEITDDNLAELLE